MAAVEITDVTKSFGETVAVNGLSLRVPDGSIYGFIGPNGSGKTTTLRMIMRILHPDRGRIHVLGEDVTESAAASERVGYLPEERGLYRKMVVKDLLRFYAELKGLRDSNRAIDQWLDRLDLAEWGDKKVESLSKGMSQKLQFIATVLHKPQLILLDEPFSGLDPVNMDVLRQAVLDLRRDGATVIFSTHDMGVAEKMCDFIFMIYKGRKVLDGTLASIRDQYSNDTLRVRLSENGEVVNRLDGVEKVNDYGQFKELRMTAGADAQQILQQLAKQCRVEHFEITQPSLHDVFVRIAGPEAEEAQHA
ncbi:MAG: ATP-binding cassette domain-containing protein [Planctomycetota bacterium]|nr:ATP-binding cassette domain-containing protein [Planctomycetota bacterium]MCZ6816719.1 ATP-binding cassette domain-containing protein [Planctomycetota bacterium]